MHLSVRVKVSAKKEVFEQITPHRFTAAVKEPAERNEANARVITLIARHLGVSHNRVRIISGHHSPAKLLEIV